VVALTGGKPFVLRQSLTIVWHYSHTDVRFDNILFILRDFFNSHYYIGVKPHAKKTGAQKTSVPNAYGSINDCNLEGVICNQQPRT